MQEAGRFRHGSIPINASNNLSTHSFAERLSDYNFFYNYNYFFQLHQSEPVSQVRISFVGVIHMETCGDYAHYYPVKPTDD